MSSAPPPLPRLPDDFPRNPKGCEETSAAFFQCFSSRTQAMIKPVNSSGEPMPRSKATEAEELAATLKLCSASLKAYESCLTTIEKTKPAKRFRVSFYTKLEYYCTFVTNVLTYL